MSEMKDFIIFVGAGNQISDETWQNRFTSKHDIEIIETSRGQIVVEGTEVSVKNAILEMPYLRYKSVVTFDIDTI